MFFLLFFCHVDLVYAKYVRKNLKPNFFVPETDMFNKPEKLPPIIKIGYEKPVKKISANDVIEENNINKISKEKIVVNENIPYYQKIFDIYSEDMKFINKHKVMPINNRLNADLEAFNSDKMFRVDDNNDYPENKVTMEFERILKQVISY